MLEHKPFSLSYPPNTKASAKAGKKSSNVTKFAIFVTLRSFTQYWRRWKALQGVSSDVTLRPLSEKQPTFIIPNAFMFKRGQIEFKSMIDSMLNLMISNGDLDRIFDAHPDANKVFRPIKSYEVGE